MGPYWLDDAPPVGPGPRYDGRVDVAIVGGGITGCSCALTLAGAGLRVRVHDARQVAEGASGRNGGFALRGGAARYDVARESYGAAWAPVSMRIASHGHASTHSPHTTQSSSSISKIAGRFSIDFELLSSGTIVMQCAGHTVGQHMQATQRTAPSSRSVSRCRPRNRSG